MSERFSEPASPENKETQKPTEPAILIRSDEDWQRGRLIEDWVSADQPMRAMQRDIKGLLGRSPIPRAKEYSIIDQAGFLGLMVLDLGIMEISKIGRAIAKHGEPFARYLGEQGMDYILESAATFEKAYCGSFKDLDDFAENYLRRAPGVPIGRVEVQQWDKTWFRPPHEGGFFVFKRDPNSESA